MKLTRSGRFLMVKFLITKFSIVTDNIFIGICAFYLTYVEAYMC